MCRAFPSFIVCIYWWDIPKVSLFFLSLPCFATFSEFKHGEPHEFSFHLIQTTMTSDAFAFQVQTFMLQKKQRMLWAIKRKPWTLWRPTETFCNHSDEWTYVRQYMSFSGSLSYVGTNIPETSCSLRFMWKCVCAPACWGQMWESVSLWKPVVLPDYTHRSDTFYELEVV